MNSIFGDDETVPWPAYTSRLDIEPELAVVYGNEEQPVAGFCIFNDIWARDVQALEFVGGFCLTKDMAKGNQLGPYLVTPDEVGDPFNLAVTVTVNGRMKYQASTSEISHKAEDVFAWLAFIAPPRPGTVMGFGTIPDCTGLDHDDFIDPGSDIQVTFERLGTLRCRFAEPLAGARAVAEVPSVVPALSREQRPPPSRPASPRRTRWRDCGTLDRCWTGASARPSNGSPGKSAAPGCSRELVSRSRLSSRTWNPGPDSTSFSSGFPASRGDRPKPSSNTPS
jgi:hypothetical protein